MTWAAPWAWALAAAVALPLVAHLWSRRQPRSVEFPTLRFLQATSPVSRRLHTLHDRALLAWRAIIVMAAVAAAAGPTIGSAARRDDSGPLHRVIVVDDAVRAEVGPLVERLRRESTAATVLQDVPIASALAEGIAEASHAARRTRSELVLIWDGSQALLPGDLADVPAYVGIRLEPVSARQASTFAAFTAPTIDIIGETTATAQVRASLLEALEGVRLPRAEARVELRWAEPPSRAAAAPSAAVVPARLRRLSDDLARDVRLRDAALRSGPLAPTGRSPLAGALPLETRIEDARLIVESHVSPQAPLTWWAAVAPLEALVPWERIAAPREPWPSDAVRAATRAAAPAEVESEPGGRHTRLAWVLVLALLAVEQWWRSRIREERDAA